MQLKRTDLYPCKAVCIEPKQDCGVYLIVKVDIKL